VNILGQVTEDEIYINKEVPPVFPGGELKFYCFLDDNLDKSIISQNFDKKGFYIFTIDTTGKINEIKVKRSITKDIDNEIIRVLKLSPNWTPGRYIFEDRLKKMKLEMTLPFKIPYESKCLQLPQQND
tara:strand:+ start:178 stop:561 length:384 start_codon:yes stop_codon:yes gene_type:complete